MKKIILPFVFFLLTINVFSQSLEDCSECSIRVIDGDKLNGLTKTELRLLKNEIYARRGYTFSSKDLKDHFSRFSWYKPLGDNSKIKLSEIETQNVDLINSQMKNVLMAEEYRESEYFENSKYKYLSDEEVERIFTHEKKKELGITYDIWKVYSYSDKSGKYYLVLTERQYKEAISERGYIVDRIRGINYKREGGQLVKTFEMNDFVNSNGVDYNSDIHFYTRYIYVEDFDEDGYQEPIIIYGASDGYVEDSLVKILIYQKARKIAIRISNSSLDYDRWIQVDKSFYSLPKAIKERVIRQMEAMQENGHCYYPHEWKEKMDRGVLMIK